MKIAVLGCGSLGTIVGAMLSKNGKDITMIDGYYEHVMALNDKGAKIVGTMEMSTPVKACLVDEIDGYFDVVIYMGKRPNNEEYLTKILPHIKKEGVVCTLQNGLPEDDVAKYVGRNRVVGGIVGWGASLRGPGISEMTTAPGEKQNYEVGRTDGKITPELKQVNDILNFAGNSVITDKLLNMRWTKLAINGSFSGMSAALGCNYGDILNNEKALICAAFVKDELIKVAHGQGIKLMKHNGVDFEKFELKNGIKSFKEVIPYYEKWYTSHRKVIASMLFDLRIGRKTEIEAINGVVSSKGKELGIKTPFNDKVIEIVRESEMTNIVTSFDNLKRFDCLLKNLESEG
jgi:2-dehydropantoate 2-reductase